MHDPASSRCSQQAPFGISGRQPEAAAIRVAVSEASEDGLAAALDGLDGQG